MRPVNLLFVLCFFMVSACTEAPLESYEPVVDRFLVDRVQYNRDITECRSVATGAMAQAKQRRDAQMAPNISDRSVDRGDDWQRIGHWI